MRNQGSSFPCLPVWLALALVLAPACGQDAPAVGQPKQGAAPAPAAVPPVPPGAPAAGSEARSFLADSVTRTLEQPGCRISYSNLEPSGRPAPESSTEVFRRPDFSHFRMAAGRGEFYSKGDRLVIKDSEKGTWSSAEELGPVGAPLRERVRRADQVLQVVLEGADQVEASGDETLGVVPCLVLQIRSEPETVRLRTQERLANPVVREGLVRKGIADAQPVLESCSIEFRVWIDRKEKLVRRLQTLNHLVLRTATGDTDIAGSRQLDFTSYNEGLDEPIPDEVKEKLGLSK
ncbi:MAG: hypothetical protein HYZ53_22085 [Planctomycetes bacterium]|nr:hypothetical protein [Planctomycetota bacterium]